MGTVEAGLGVAVGSASELHPDKNKNRVENPETTKHIVRIFICTPSCKAIWLYERSTIY